MTVKCRKCEKQIDKSVAYKVCLGKSNYYYCSEDEYVSIEKAKELQNNIYNTIYEVMEYQSTNSVLFKEITEIIKVHSADKLYSYLQTNKDFLNTLMQKRLQKRIFSHSVFIRRY